MDGCKAGKKRQQNAVMARHRKHSKAVWKSFHREVASGEGQGKDECLSDAVNGKTGGTEMKFPRGV